MDSGAESYRRYLAGEDEGLAEIVRAYKDGLILYLNGYVNDLPLAEELAEDTFFRLIAKRPRFSGRSSFKFWLYAIGRHVAVDWLRRNARLVSAPAETLEACLREEQSLEQAFIRDEGKIAPSTGRCGRCPPTTGPCCGWSTLRRSPAGRRPASCTRAPAR